MTLLFLTKEFKRSTSAILSLHMALAERLDDTPTSALQYVTALLSVMTLSRETSSSDTTTTAAAEEALPPRTAPHTRRPFAHAANEGSDELSPGTCGGGGGDRPVKLVSHRASWGILPQTPVFSLRSARCHW
jgi:hypothetical protein